MKVLSPEGRVSSQYSPAADSLELTLDPSLKATATLAYQDIILIHLGKREGENRMTPVAITLNGFGQIRQRIHGLAAGNPAEKAAKAGDTLKNLEFEIKGDQVILKHAQDWEASPNRVTQKVGPHIEVVKNLMGSPIGIVFSAPHGLQEEAITELLDLIFESLFQDPRDLDPARMALGKELAVRWMGPLVAA